MVVIMESDISSNKVCNRCHRPLKTEQSKKLGFGATCYKKYLQKKKVYLFDFKYTDIKRGG